MQRNHRDAARTRQWAGSDNADPAHSSSLGEGGIFPQGNHAETVFTVLSFVDLLMSRLYRSLETVFVGSSFCVLLEEKLHGQIGPNRIRVNHSLLNGDETHDDRSDKCVRAVRHVQLLEYGGQVVLGGLGADIQPLRNLAIRRSLSQELQDFEFSLRQ
jgi:hypothetical protein